MKPGLGRWNPFKRDGSGTVNEPRDKDDSPNFTPSAIRVLEDHFAAPSDDVRNRAQLERLGDVFSTGTMDTNYSIGMSSMHTRNESTDTHASTLSFSTTTNSPSSTIFSPLAQAAAQQSSQPTTSSTATTTTTTPATATSQPTAQNLQNLQNFRPPLPTQPPSPHKSSQDALSDSNLTSNNSQCMIPQGMSVSARRRLPPRPLRSGNYNGADDQPKDPQEVLSAVRERLQQRQRTDTVTQNLSAHLSSIRDDGVYETIAQSALIALVNHHGGVAQSTLLELLRDEENANERYEQLQRYVERLISGSGSTNPTLSKSELIKVIEHTKDPKDRAVFLAILKRTTDSERGNIRLDAVCFEHVVVVFQALLRFCWTKQDYAAATDVLAFACKLHKIEANQDKTLVLIALKTHELWQHMPFWESKFLEMLDGQREQILGEEVYDCIRNWNSMSDVEIEEWTSTEHRIVTDLVLFFADLMRTLSVDTEGLKKFVSLIALPTHLDKAAVDELMRVVEASGSGGALESNAPGSQRGKAEKSLLAQLSHIARGKGDDAIRSTESNANSPPSPTLHISTTPNSTTQPSAAATTTMPTTPNNQQQQQMRSTVLPSPRHHASGGGVSFALLGGEIVQLVIVDCVFVGAVVKAPGRLVVTNFRVVFEPNLGIMQKEAVHKLHELRLPEFFSVPIGMCLRIDSFADSVNIVCKDIRSLRFGVPNGSVDSLVASVVTLCAETENLFAFVHKPPLPHTGHSNHHSTTPNSSDHPTRGLIPQMQHLMRRGSSTMVAKRSRTRSTDVVDSPPPVWSVFNAKEEFSRMGVEKRATQWRFTSANQNYTLCSSYPATIVVPARVSDTELQAVGDFRSKRRVPMLCWLHASNDASLCRCAQPLTGFTRQRCYEDEKIVKEITRANPNSNSLIIVDARAKSHAVGNQVMGKGFEPTEFYEGSNLLFMGIENIHVVRDSYFKLRELVSRRRESHWFSALENTGWLKHIQSILRAVCQIVEFIDEKAISVLVHCSDGWDRTSQLTSLSQLVLDPHYRTIQGFWILVEKEWLAAGHMFSTRCGHTGSRRSVHDQWSPIFLQFIDCTWQLTHQYPRAFEFNTNLLLFLIDCAYTCKYGDFLCDNESDRMKFRAGIRAPRAWDEVCADLARFTNSAYERTHGIVMPTPSMRRLRLWTDLYLRWDVTSADFHPSTGGGFS